MKSACYRQGDVYLIGVTALPPSGERVPRGAVLAEGEATGHKHRFSQPAAVEVFASGGRMFVDVLEDSADLIHEEHGTIGIPRGSYEVRIQREYTPQGIQRVVD